MSDFIGVSVDTCLTGEGGNLISGLASRVRGDSGSSGIVSVAIFLDFVLVVLAIDGVGERTFLAGASFGGSIEAFGDT